MIFKLLIRKCLNLKKNTYTEKNIVNFNKYLVKYYN